MAGSESGSNSGGAPLGQDLVNNQRLQTALHLAVGQVSIDAADNDGAITDSTTFSKAKFEKEVVATVSQLAFNHLKTLAEDCEAFARHAKRSTIQSEDIRLFVRRNKNLHNHISSLCSNPGQPASEGTKRKFKGDSVGAEATSANRARKKSRKSDNKPTTETME